MKIKWIVTGLVALVVAVVVAGFAILSTMEFEELRGVIEAEAKEATGRELEIAGPIDLKISLTPAITLEEVRFANAAWGSRADMVSVRRFELEVALLPLLSGDIQVKRLVVIEPDILIETDKKGRGNWEIAAPAETGEKAEEEAGPATLPNFDRVVVRDAVLTYRDGQTGEEFRVRLSKLAALKTSRAVPLEIAFEGAYNEVPFQVEGAVGLIRNLVGAEPYPVQLDVAVGGAKIAVDGRIAEPLTGEGIDLKIQASGQSLADLGALGGVALPPLGPYDLSAQVAQDGKGYKLTGLTAKIGSSDIAGNATIALGKPRPTLNGSFTSGTLDLDDFAPPGAEGTPAAPAEAPLPLDSLKAIDAKIKLSVKRLRLHDSLPLSDLDLSLVLKKGNLKVKPFSVGVAGGKLAGGFSIDAGKKVPPLAVKLSASGIDYGGLLKDLDVIDGVSGRLDAKVDLRAAGASLNAIAAGLNGRIEVTGLTAKVGASDIAGKATIALGGRRPALSGSFTSGTLDLDDLARLGVGGTPGAPAEAQPKTAEPRFVFTEDPLPFEALDALDAKIKLSVKRLRLRVGLPLTDLDLSLALKNRRLAVKPFSVGIAGGKLAGGFSVDAGKKVPPVAVNLSASGIDYGGLLKDLDVTDGVSGRLDAKVDLRGAGASARAIAAGLGGRIEVIGGQGSISNDLVRTAGAGLTQMLSGWSESGGDLRINCIVVRLPVEGGVATSEAILLDTAAATVGATGSIDLRDESLDLRVTPQAKQTSLMSLAVPFLVKGTLSEPSVGPDPVGTAVGVAKIAGMFINPLAAGAALVMESEASDQNPCVAALDQPAQAPAQAPAQGTTQPSQEKSPIEDAAKGVGDALEGVGEGITKGLKGLFGD